ncbi:ATP-binding protein [Chengkuizengella marina]|uniref:histidine kinase n=1 Tax=Chengkuizengella marina TaxID=2507566 RepID=A0A6N9Q8B6_9BACL|nr:HAMP domain-containing sensor histidine kinase [Chengkuizengella marina]NBI31117.1 HAMP domain-containing histidine kinase [Chengkuizengella marina]
MSKNSERKLVPLLKYWTIRYFLILLFILVMIAIFLGYWIKYSTIQNELNLREGDARYISSSLSVNEELILENPRTLSLFMEKLKRSNSINNAGILQIYHSSGKLLYQDGSMIKGLKGSRVRVMSFKEVDQQTTEKIQLKLFTGDLYHIVTPIISGEQIIGYVSMIIPQNSLLGDKSNFQFSVLIISFISLSVTGWIIIYWLLKKLTNPIRLVADAAVQIRQGNYEIQLNKNFKEKELNELNQSFEDMAARLKSLETLRTELLAGVTHEIKTPVTSISGLVQAVKDKVVTKEEEEEFLQLALQESNRLQLMVEDLLDFNSYAAGVIHLDIQKVNLNTIVHAVAKQWRVMDEEVSMTLSIPEQELFAEGDPLRIKQVLFNLLKNSQAAMKEEKKVVLKVYPYDAQFVAIDVTDSGSGIPIEEQANIFERFFRGSEKKDTVRGLGLGLSLSKILAGAQKGDLKLKESSNQGTTFTLLLPKKD